MLVNSVEEAAVVEAAKVDPLVLSPPAEEVGEIEEEEKVVEKVENAFELVV